MQKQKSVAQIHVADGTGGMRLVSDLRFDVDSWPIEIVVQASEAETWMAQLSAEIELRGWTLSSLSQLGAEANSGSLQVNTSNGQSPPSLDIIWERLRGKELQIRARASGDPPLSLDISHELFRCIAERVSTGATQCLHQQVLLVYDGLPWRGELWLDSDHRLGPPSKYPDSLIGPQILIVDAMVEGVGRQGVSANFDRWIRELRVFL